VSFVECVEEQIEPLPPWGLYATDYRSCRSCAPSLNAGMDHEMPDASDSTRRMSRPRFPTPALRSKTIDRVLVRTEPRRLLKALRSDGVCRQHLEP
jgi:hypothetical protein